MKITKIETTLVNAQLRNRVFVRVEPDQPGLHGCGEGALEWKTRAVAGAVEDLSPLLLRRDPRDVGETVEFGDEDGAPCRRKNAVPGDGTVVGW